MNERLDDDGADGDSSNLGSLLDFDPVPRRVKRPDGWTPELQREFIRLLAKSGSPQQACTEMDKNVTGIEALYKVPSADSFRAAWDEAVRIGRRAQGLDAGPPHLGPVPGITRRGQRAAAAQPNRGGGDPTGFRGDPDDDMAEKSKVALLENLFRKHLLKVQKERRARLAGDVVGADFTLRQITVVEIALDLLAEDLGRDVWQTLAELRRGGHGLVEIAETPISRVLDARRRERWAAMAEPERPEHPPQRHLKVFADFSLEPIQVFGPASDPPPGINPEIWSAMSADEQRLALAEFHRQAAEEQVEWESQAVAEHKEQSRSDT